MTTTLTAVRAITLLIDNDGDGLYDPGDTVKTTLTVTNTGAQDATNVTISDPNLLLTVTNVSPVAVNDYFTAVGNTVLRVGGAANIGSGPSSVVAGSVLSNDFDSGPGSNSFTITTVANGTSLQGGIFNLNSNGSFNYVSAAGFEGNDTFTYTITDGSGLTGTGLVTIAVGGAAGQVWYVDSAAGAGGTGTSANPFNTITATNLGGAGGAGDVDGAGDFIYVKGAATGNLPLEASEHLIGQGSALTVGGFALATAGTNSALSASTGTTVTLSTSNELAGININGTGTAGGISGSSFGTLTVASTAINTAGQALSLNTGALAGTGFTSTTSTGGTNNVALTSVTGQVNLGTGALSGATGNAVNINGGNGGVDYDGTVTHTLGAQAIVVTGKTGGTVQFDGAVVSNTSSSGVSLTNNTGATINFNGGLTVDIASGTGFAATGGGTVNVIGANNSIKSVSGTAVNINGTTIGASGITLHDVSSGNNTAAADPTVGISLVNTGSTGFFRVTGGTTTTQGGDASGGTIQHITGTDGTTQDDGTSNGQGIGIYLNNASNVTLDRMQINDTSNFAVEVENSTNVVLSYSKINGQNGDSAAQDEGAIRILDLHGSNRLFNNDISGGFEDNVRVDNSSGNLTALFIDSNNIHDNNAASGNQGVLIDVENGITAAYFIQNNKFSHNRADSVFVGASGGAASASALVDATITGNTFQGNRASDLGGGLAIHTANFDGHLQYDVSNNNLQPTAGNLGVNQGGAIDIDAGAASSTAVHSTLVEGRISNNLIGVTGVANSGTQQGSGILLGLHGGGTHTVAVTGNTIRQYGNSGVQITAGDSGITGGNFNLTVTGNTITEKANAAGAAPNGLLATFGTSSTGPNSFHVNLDISGNSLAGSGNNVNIGEEDFRIRQRFSTDIFLKGYTGALDDTAAVVAYVQSQNVGSETGTATTQSAADAVGFHNLASVPQPTLPPAPPTPPAPGSAPAGAPLLAARAPDAPSASAWTRIDGEVFGMIAGEYGLSTLGRAAPHAAPAVDVLNVAAADRVAATQPVTDPATPAVDGGSGGQPVVVDDGVLSQAELNLVVAAAIDRWAAAGASAEQVAAMRAVSVSVADLGGLELGKSSPGAVAVDVNAAGYSWFVDGTAGEDSEFADGHGLAGTPASTRVDLLTVIAHELGHQIGLYDQFGAASVNDLMFGTINAGDRRLPSTADVAGSGTTAVTETAFALSPVNIGTLSPGQSSTLTWISTVDPISNQLIPTGAAASSASTVTAGNVTGAVVSNTNTLTLDSLALGNLIFNDVNHNGLFDAGDVGVSGVTLTLFADNNGNGVLDGAETTNVITTTTSTAGGAYSFTGLAPGDYVLRVDAANFTGAGALSGKLLTAPGATDPDDNVNNDNNGFVSSGAVFTAPIRLDFNQEPTPGPFNDTNNTLDIGVFAPDVAPTLTATGGSPIYNEDAAAVDLYSAVTATIGAGDSGQTFSSLTLTVSNVTDGASEILRIDGTDVPLTAGSVLTATNGLTVNVALAGSLATVSFSGAALNVAQLQTLVDGLSYRDSSQNPTDANRVVTIKQLVDSGSNTAPNVNTATLNIASTVDVNPVNDAPAGTDGSASTPEDTPLALTLANFGFTDPAEGNGFLSVKITTLPTNGVLRLSGTAVNAGDFVLASAISAGNLVFTPTADANGAPLTSFTFQVRDNGGTANGGVDLDPTPNTLSITVTATNDAPVVDLNGATAGTGNAVTFTENGAALAFAPAAVVTDIDSADLAGGSLTVVFTSGPGDPSDRLIIGNQGSGAGQIGYAPGTGVVSFGGVAIGQATGFNTSGPLTVTFNASATPAAAQALVRDILYSNTSDTPVAGTKTLDFTVNDGDGGSSVATATLTVVAVDDLPTAGNDSNAVLENATILGASVLGNDGDVDGPALSVATVNGSAVNVGTQITLASGALLTLRANGTYDYNPNGKFDYLTDNTSGAVDTSATDSFTYTLTGPSNTATVTITVNGVAGPGDILFGDGTNNTITGTPGPDMFRLDQGGNDTAFGLGGDDGFIFGATLTSADVVDGGAGTNDQIAIQGNYTGANALTLGNITNVEALVVLPGNDTRYGDTAGNFYSYSVTTIDANVAAGQQLQIDANKLRVGENFVFDGSAETDGSFFVYGGFGNDTMTGGANNDGFLFRGVGVLNTGDHIDGGGGTNDQIGLRGDYSGANAVVLTNTTITNVEALVLVSGHDLRFGLDIGDASYELTTANGNVPAGARLTVDAGSLRPTEHLTFNGAAETDGTFRIFGGQGNDTITGGSGADSITGGLGADSLTGGAGADSFLYRTALESTTTSRDTIQDFTTGDLINLLAIDADSTGGGNEAFTFIGSGAFTNHAGELRAVETAVGSHMWTVSGDVDGNGTADFQLFVNVTDLHPLTATDFVL